MKKQQQPEIIQFAFQAILNRLTTTVDGGWKITFEIDNSETNTITELAKYKDAMLQLAIVPILN